MNIRSFALVFTMVGLLGLSGCRNNDYSYEKGYRKGWELGKLEESFSLTDEERDGYIDGYNERLYVEGYDVGVTGGRPLYLSEYWYMKGYKEGKSD